MAIKSPAQGRSAFALSSPQGRLQREVHSIQKRCQETLRRAKARKVEMELEEARRRADKEKYRVEIEENKRLREEAKLKEEERKRKEKKKLRLEMKEDLKRIIKGVEEARKDFKELFKPIMEPRVHVAAVINADSASLPSPVPQNDQVAHVPVPVVIHSQGEKKVTEMDQAPAVPILSQLTHQACAAPVPVVSASEGEKKERKNLKKLSNLEIEAPAPIRVLNTQNDEEKVFQELDLDLICWGENIQVKDMNKLRKYLKMKAAVPVMDSCQGDKKKVEKKNKEREEQQKMKHVFASTIPQSDFVHHKGEKKRVKVQLGDSVRAAPKPVTENLVKPLVNKPVMENLKKKKEIKEGKKTMFQSSVLMHHKIRT